VKQEKKNPEDSHVQAMASVINRKPQGLKWEQDEDNRLIEGLRRYGKDYDRITQYVGTRSRRKV
jgi:hypothetical protein